MSRVRGTRGPRASAIGAVLDTLPEAIALTLLAAVAVGSIWPSAYLLLQGGGVDLWLPAAAAPSYFSSSP